jgi:hypothetical protein
MEMLFSCKNFHDFREFRMGENFITLRNFYKPGVLQKLGPASRAFKIFAVLGTILEVASVVHEWKNKSPNRIMAE